jgi:hypothetical protein
VPQADYSRDYEQLWKEQKKDVGVKRRRDDGTYDVKGYYIGDSEDEELPQEKVVDPNAQTVPLRQRR